jgi:hypothetical protein
MKKQIYTLTCTWAPSYGAVLQAYALAMCLCGCGYNAKILDYEPDWLNTQEHNTSLRKLLSPVLHLKNLLLNAKYLDFLAHEEVLTDRLYRNAEEIRNARLNADFFIVGSDQVWNCTKYYNGKDDAMFLSFVKDNQKKISYAASLAMPAVPKEQIKRYKEALSSFDAISVREKSGAKALNKIGIRNISVVIDPVYLLNQTQYSELSKNSSLRLGDKQYLLVVCLEERDSVYQYAKRRADELGIELYTITDGVNGLVKNRKEVDKKLWNRSVYDYLDIFANAEEVVADSFHAISFALIFQKNVHVILRGDNGNSRMIDLLTELGLSDRITDGGKIVTEDIDFINVNKVIDKKRRESIDFLKRALDIDAKEDK